MLFNRVVLSTFSQNEDEIMDDDIKGLQMGELNNDRFDTPSPEPEQIDYNQYINELK